MKCTLPVRAIALLACGAVFSPVCGMAADASTDPPSTPHTYTILIKGLQFIPAELQVHVGDTVIWTNADIVPHTIMGTRSFDSKDLAAGKSWRLRARHKGRFDYACGYHPTMHGVLIVR